MRIARYFPWVLLGLALVPAFDWSSAPTTRSARAQVFATETAPARPIAGFDLGKLPVGKVIGESASRRKIRELLEQPCEFAATCLQLGDLAEELERKYKIPVQFDVAALASDGKGTETVLNGFFKNTPLRSGLKRLLEPHGLVHVVNEDYLTITTRTAAETITPTRVYQIHDLVIFPNDPTSNPNHDYLIEVITSIVVPESWREAGGIQGEIKWFEAPGVMALVITQTDEVHEKIEQLLANVRTAKVAELIELQEKRDRLVRSPNQPATITLPAASPARSLGGTPF